MIRLFGFARYHLTRDEEALGPATKPKAPSSITMALSRLDQTERIPSRVNVFLDRGSIEFPGPSADSSPSEANTPEYVRTWMGL